MAFLAASVAVHAALLLWAPTPREPRAHVEVLEVRLARPEATRPEQPLALEQRTQQTAKARAVEKKSARVGTEERLPLQPAEPPRTLALPAPAQSAVTVPAASGDESMAGAPPRQDVARAAPAASPAPAPVVPPGFNAEYLRNPPPRYPPSARRNGEQGTVTLKVRVTREGAPADVTIDRTSGSSALDHAAMEAVRGWRFVPARQGSQPVEAWVLVPIVFRLES